MYLACVFVLTSLIAACGGMPQGRLVAPPADAPAAHAIDAPAAPRKSAPPLALGEPPPSISTATTAPTPTSSPAALPSPTDVAASVGPGQRARSADEFVDSIGINTALAYTTTPYFTAYPTVRTLLLASGVRHIRDGLDTSEQWFYDRLNELGRSGIHSTLVTPPNASAQLLQSYPARVRDSFEAYEGPNELDLNGGPNWVAVARQFQQFLYVTVKGNPATARFPVIGPSLTSPQAYRAVGDLSNYLDFGNMHNYFAGRNPGSDGWGSAGFGSSYGSIVYSLGAAAQTSKNKPVISTETGNCTRPGGAFNVTLAVQGKYLPRMFFEQFNRGVARTFDYELLDNGSAEFSGCGLLTHGLAPKPAYHALKGLVGLLADPGPTFSPGTLAFSLGGNAAHVHHTLLQKRDGSFFLALWIELPSYEPNDSGAGHEVAVPAQRISMNFSPAVRASSISSFDDTGNLSTRQLSSTNEISIDLTDRVTVVRLIPVR